MGQVFGSDESGQQMLFPLNKIQLQPVENAFSVLFLRQAKVQHQGRRGLGLADQTAVGRDILRPEFFQYVLIQRAPGLFVLLPAKRFSRPGHDVNGIEIIRVADEAEIGAAALFLVGGIHEALRRPAEGAFGGVQGDPVAELGTVVALQQPLFAGQTAGIFHAGGHAVILLLQEAPVPIGLVNHPGHDGGGLVPDGHVHMRPENIRHGEGNAEQIALLRPQIPQPFAVEQGQMTVENGGGQEDLRVACVSQALVPLGAVHGNIQIVGAHGPVDILPEPVDFFIAAGKMPRTGKIRMQHAGGEGGGIRVFDALDGRVPEPVIGEGGEEDVLLPAAHEGIRRFGGAQIDGKQIAVFIQRFRVAQGDLGPPGKLQARFHHARQILAEVQDGFAPGRGQHLPHRHSLGDAHGLAFLARQDLLRVFIGPGLDGRLFGKGIINDLAVIQLAGPPGPGGGLPAFIGADPLPGAVGIAQIDLGQQGGPGSVMVSLAVKTQDALIPAVAYRHLQAVFLLQAVCEIIGLHLQPLLIGGPAGSQEGVPNPLPVELHLIDAQGRYIGPGPKERFADGKSAAEHGAGDQIVLKAVGNPAGLHALPLHQPGFKKAFRGSGFVPAVAYLHQHLIAGLRQKGFPVIDVINGLIRFRQPGIPHRTPVPGDPDAAGVLTDVPAVGLQFPGKSRFLFIQPDGIGSVLRLQISDFQHTTFSS